jgi:CRP-like cAMP-binding protein
MREPSIVVAAAGQLESPLLKGLTVSDRDKVLSASSERRVRADSVIVHQGDPADHLFLISKGCARYFYITPQGKKIVLFWLMPGQIFGGSALLPTPTEYLVGTEVLKDVLLLVWRRSRIRALASHIPRLLDNALTVANDYLTWYLAAHTSLVSHTAEQRLAQVLVTLAHGFGHKASGGTRVELTNEQLASAANVTPFTASRILSSWQRNGAVVKSRGEILLRSPERLSSVHF